MKPSQAAPAAATAADAPATSAAGAHGRGHLVASVAAVAAADCRPGKIEEANLLIEGREGDRLKCRMKAGCKQQIVHKVCGTRRKGLWCNLADT